MKREDGLWTFVIFIGCNLLVLALLSPLFLVPRMNVDKTDCVHQWSKWGDVVDNGSYTIGPRWQQTRLCEQCGRGQVRDVEWVRAR